jgi:hypothetical protein
MLAAISREPVDYVPCCGGFNPLDRVLRRGHTWNFPWPEDASAEEKLRYQVETLGLDQVVSVGVGVTRQADGCSSETRLDGDVLHKTFATPAGELHAAVRYNEMWPHGENIPFYSDFNIGHYVEPWLQNEQDLDCLRQLQMLRPADEIVADAQASVSASKALADRFGLATSGSAGMGLTGAQHLFGATDLCMMVIDDPELVDDYLEHEHQINLCAIEALGELGVDIARRNGFYETADFYSPAMLDRFLTRRLNAEADAVRAAGMVTAYTAHTGIMPILDYLADLTVESIFGIDIEFGDMDIRQVRDKLGDRKSFWIGPSSTYHIWQGPEPTRQAVRDVFECFGHTGLILSQGVSSHSIMPWESTAAMIDEWRKLR